MIGHVFLASVFSPLAFYTIGQKIIIIISICEIHNVSTETESIDGQDTMASAGELEMDYVKSIPFSTDILYTNFKRKSVESQTGNFAT